MSVRLHPHAAARLLKRGSTEAEIVSAVETGEKFTAKFGRTGFRRNFAYNKHWRGRLYATKQVEAIAIEEGEGWLVITVLVKFF